MSLNRTMHGLGVGLISGGFVLLALLSVFSLHSWKRYHLSYVLSGSMRPALSVGSLIFSQRILPQDYRAGDIVLFKAPDQHSIWITHRLIAVRTENKQFVGLTKGDANDSADAWTIPLGALEGRIIFSVPLLGYPIYWIKTHFGFLVFTLLFFVFIVLQELLWLISILGPTKGKQGA